MTTVKILIGADIVPAKTSSELFRSNDIDALCGKELIQLLETADFRIFNLETPLTDEASPIEKVGPCFIAPRDAIRGIKGIGTDFVTLANNHIMDQGPQGLASTLDMLATHNIMHAGVGQNAEAAAKPHIIQVKDKKIGIYCCTEREFSVATDHSIGANVFDPLESLDHIARLHEQSDYTICLYHGGKEHFRYPSPYLQKVCRKIIEKGADLVVCQHSHCIGCEEYFGNGTIVYGQGNFLVDHSRNDFRHTALLIEVAIGDHGVAVTYHPLYREGHGIRLAAGQAGAEILKDFRGRSREISQPDFVAMNYRAHCLDRFSLLLELGGKATSNILLKGINKILGGRFAKWFAQRNFTKKNRMLLKNRIECEAWREMILTILNGEEQGKR